MSQKYLIDPIDVYEINVYIPFRTAMEKFLKNSSYENYMIFEVAEKSYEANKDMFPDFVSYNGKIITHPLLVLFYTNREEALEKFDNIVRKLRGTDAEDYTVEIYRRSYDELVVPMGTNARSNKLLKYVTYNTNWNTDLASEDLEEKPEEVSDTPSVVG